MADISPEDFGAIWEDVIADTEATAADYRDEGWETVELTVGDVTALPTGHPKGVDAIGLDVLVPGDEFAALQSLVEGASFDDFEAYRAETAGYVLLVIVMRDAETRTAVFIPAYYAVADAEEMIEAAREAGEIHTYVRPLSDDAAVVFDHGDVDPLLPTTEIV